MNILFFCPDFQTFGKPNDLDARNRFLNKLSKIYIVYHSTIISFMVISSLFYIPQCKENNIVKNQKEVCGLPALTWLPFNFDVVPFKQIVYLYQVYSVLIVYQTAGLLSFFMFATLEHLVLRFNHVGDMFVETLSEKNPVIRRQKFIVAVKYHQAVIEMGNLVNRCFSPCMMVHISLTGPFIGVAAYTFLTKIPLDTTALMIGWMISTFTVCQGGQRLMEASLNIGNIMYKVDWYNLEADLQKDLLLVIIRSRKPVYLRAGPFGPITYSTISTILKTSYSYVTLLLQTM
ncbi:unnamed protein product [Psylliodes chrysocephalus]|uniref:Odorant receptor n=1 Tax=Psylliodes chrysocephalus TaxID=3402493 RepID=A0A9P0DAW8_9CUCU|nr:unnamed protein product [Psylliodes chrysocephala]